MKTFTFFWKTGKREVLKGAHAFNALTTAGYSSSALQVLDCFAEGDSDRYYWDSKRHTWIGIDIKPGEFKAKVYQDSKFLYYREEADGLLGTEKILAGGLPDRDKMEYLTTWNCNPGKVEIYRHEDLSLWGFVTGTGEGLYAHRRLCV